MYCVITGVNQNVGGVHYSTVEGGIGIHFLGTIQPGRVNAPPAPLNAAWYIISKGHAVAESVTQYVATRSGFNYILHVYIPLVKVSD